MEPAFHRMTDLFRQFGLPDDPASIEVFFARRQARLLREELGAMFAR